MSRTGQSGPASVRRTRDKETEGPVAAVMGQGPSEMRKTGQDGRGRPSMTVRKLWPAYEMSQFRIPEAEDSELGPGPRR